VSRTDYEASVCTRIDQATRVDQLIKGGFVRTGVWCLDTRLARYGSKPPRPHDTEFGTSHLARLLSDLPQVSFGKISEVLPGLRPANLLTIIPELRGGRYQ
jgi:hypothetical protein